MRQRHPNLLPFLYFLFVMSLAMCWLDSQAAEVYPVIEAEHVSDILRGNAPWAKDEPEPYHDHVMAGITITFRGRIELDLLHGYKRPGGTSGPGIWQTGTTARIRWYPFRRRN